MSEIIIKIQQSGSDLLSKEQKNFNMYIERLKKLNEDLIYLEKQTQHVLVRVEGELMPLKQKMFDQARLLVLELDTQLEKLPKLTRKQRQRAIDILVEYALPLIVEHGKIDLIPLIEKYERQADLDNKRKQAQSDFKDEMRNIVRQMNLDLDVEQIETEYDFQMELAKAIAKQQEQDETQNQIENLKTDKQQEKEAKMKARERQISLSTKIIYKNLVKAFHPDKEPDEQKRIQKTERMQQINHAYQSDNLLLLLEIQNQYMNQASVQNFDNQELKNMNILLQRQIKDLKNKCDELQQNPYFTKDGINQVNADKRINSRIKETKRNINEMKYTISTIKIEAHLKDFILSYELENEY